MKIPAIRKGLRIPPAAKSRHQQIFRVIPKMRRRVFLEELDDEVMYSVWTLVHGSWKVKVFDGARLKYGDLKAHKVVIEKAGPLKALKTPEEKAYSEFWLNQGNTTVLLPKGLCFWAQAVDPRKYRRATANRLNTKIGWN